MMDWFKTNPVTASIGAAALLVAIAGVYFVYSEAVRFGDEQIVFEQKSAQLQSLWANKPFPNNANAEAAEQEATQAKEALSDLATVFGPVEMPVLSPQAFQDELSKAVKDIEAMAAKKGVKLPEGFYLGFEVYETQPPPEAESAQLGLQLRSIQAVVRTLIDSKTTSVDTLVRTPLVGEVGGQSPAANNGTPAAVPGNPSFQLLPFDIVFTADQPAFRLAINRISELKPPVFVRLAAISNSMAQPPLKSAPPESSEAASETADSRKIKPVFGRESLRVELRLASVAGQYKAP